MREAFAALAAANFAGERIAVAVSAAGCCTVAAGQLPLHRLPRFAVDDGLVVIFQFYQWFLAVVVLLFVRQIVRRVGLFLDQVTAVFFILQDLCHGGRRPKAVALAAENTGLSQLPRDGAAPFALLQVLMEDEPDNFRALRVDSCLLYTSTTAGVGGHRDDVAPHLPADGGKLFCIHGNPP